MRMDSNALWFRDVVSSLFATNRPEYNSEILTAI